MTSKNGILNAIEEGKRGDEAMRAAKFLLSGGFHGDAVSRAYYASFHWARALLLSKGIEPRTHRGVIQMFCLHFVKDGPLDEAVATALASLETSRELSDYESTARFSESQAERLVAKAERFIEVCRPLIPVKTD